jgi:hypothetical protein
MLGRKDYTHEELDAARRAVAAQFATYRALVAAAPAGGAAAAFEPVFLKTLVLALDRMFVHGRPVVGKDTNPLTEVELLAASLLVGDEFLAQKVVRWVPEQSVTKVAAGDPVRLDLATTEALAAAYLAEIEARFVA